MNIIISPNSFKGTFSSVEATDIIEEGLVSVSSKFKITKLPIADGGDGSLDVFKFYNNYKTIYEIVQNPLGKLIKSEYILIDKGDTAIIEFASSSGLKLIDENERDVNVSNSYGTGQLILSAINNGVKKIILSLGGSATIDGGSGILNALGINFFDKKNNIINGNHIIDLNSIDTSNFILKKKKIDFILLSDVKNTLLGKKGSVNIFGYQKGLKKEKKSYYEFYLNSFSKITDKIYRVNSKSIIGGGAAGGAAAFLKIFLNAKIYSGADFIFNHINYSKYVKKNSIIITGEGFLDSQSMYGKGPVSLSNYLKQKDIFLIAIGGRIDYSIMEKLLQYFDLILPACESKDFSFCIKNSKILLKNVSAEIGKILILRSSFLNN